MAKILIGNIRGPQGVRGPQGIQGVIGPAGPQGPLPPLVNNALATQAGIGALDAVMGKTLQDQITKQNSDKANASDITGFKSYVLEENTLTDAQIKTSFEYYIKSGVVVAGSFALRVELAKGSRYVGYGIKASNTYASVYVQSYALNDPLYGVMRDGIWTWK